MTPTRQRRTVHARSTLGVRVDPDLLARLIAEATLQGVTLSNLCEGALREWLDADR